MKYIPYEFETIKLFLDVTVMGEIHASESFRPI